MRIYVCIYPHKHICRNRDRNKDGHYELCLAWNSQRSAFQVLGLKAYATTSG